jgi:DNA-binding beta-propeller fold protein YncE
MISMRALVAISAVSLGIAACEGDVGRRPALGVLHFPSSALVSPDGRVLYVANTNFNLEFNGALVQAFDLQKIRTDALAAIAAGRPGNNADEAAYVVRDAAGAIAREAAVRVGSYVSSMALSPDNRRMYVASRGTGCVHWFDVRPDGLLECQQSSAGGACDEQQSSSNVHCVGASRSGPRSLLLPPNPTSLDVVDRAQPDGQTVRYITITHHEETRSRVSLMVQRGAEGVPVLSHFAGDFSPRLWTQLRLPSPDATASPRWIVFSRDEPVIGHVRLFEDGDRSFVFRAPPTVPTTVASALGVVHAVVDPCNATRAYAAVRARRSSGAGIGDALFSIDLSNPDEPRVVDQLSLPLGASRVVPVKRGATCAQGVELYAVLYDARKLYVVDADAWREVAQVRTQVGPAEIIADPGLGQDGRNFLYVVNFSSMCIEVVDARTRQVVFTVGEPIRPRELS